MQLSLLSTFCLLILNASVNAVPAPNSGCQRLIDTYHKTIENAPTWHFTRQILKEASKPGRPDVKVFNEMLKFNTNIRVLINSLVTVVSRVPSIDKYSQWHQDATKSSFNAKVLTDNCLNSLRKNQSVGDELVEELFIAYVKSLEFLTYGLKDYCGLNTSTREIES